MGIGGQLMWTVVAKEIYDKQKKKVVFLHNNRIIKDAIWINNPHISFNLTKNTIRIDLSKYPINNEHGNINTHTVICRCNFFNVYPKKIYPILKYTEKEELKIKNLLKELPTKFLCIEPNAKTSWTVNKSFPFYKWQNIVNELIKHNINIVQVSMPGKKLLDNVIDFRNKISSFRECACLLKYCNLFVSTEGGLMHASAANNNRSFIIYSPMFHPKKTLYDNIDHIWIHNDKHNSCNKIQR